MIGINLSMKPLMHNHFRGFSAPQDNLSYINNTNIALILPLDASGYLAEVANAFLEGFIQAAEIRGEVTSLETYRTDGQPNTDLLAYRQAVNDGAGVIVGPLLRSSVNLVSQLPIEATIPTLLLQEPDEAIHAGQLGTPSLYTFPLGVESEVIQFANFISKEYEDQDVILIADATRLSNRLIRTFAQTWKKISTKPYKLKIVVNAETWLEVHDELKEYIFRTREYDEDGNEIVAVEDLDRNTKVPPAIFIIGNSEFASVARANIPTALPIHVFAVFKTDLDISGRSLLNLSGIRYFEMPYIHKLNNQKAEVVAGNFASEKPIDLQRYVAAGIDAYKIIYNFTRLITDGSVAVNGETGDIKLNDGRFLREGIALEIQDGALVEINIEEDSSIN